MPTEHPAASATWVTFVYGSFAASVFMMGVGVFFLPVDLWIKGYLAMVMIVQTAVSATKTIRDNEEAAKLHRRIEEARTEKLLNEHNGTY